PLPRIEDIFDKLKGAKVFSNLDLASGYHQVPLTEAASDASAFITPEGHFQFNVLPFGIHSAPPAFQKMMEHVLKDCIQQNICQVYLDDILVYSKDAEQHKEHLKRVFSKLDKANLRLRPDKCNFFLYEIEHLGHIIDGQGVRVNPSKVEVLLKYTRPTTIKALQSFMGLANYYHKGFATMAVPLFALYKERVKGKKNSDAGGSHK
ncbi:reverse transcriptase family protein, partial [Nitrosomonas sp.]|uniref:reverse transcriptase family protein n=1 Tax=Nitrosomonas sp. TaxID=42353 RepID=UPI0025F41996